MTEQQTVQEALTVFFDKVGITGDFSIEKEGEAFAVTLATEEVGMIVGYHGEILESLQLLASLAVSKAAGNFTRVSLEVGDYRKNRTTWLERIAQETKERALFENKEIAIPDLKSWERRIVHLMFQDDKDVVSESVGQGRERTLVVKPRG